MGLSNIMFIGRFFPLRGFLYAQRGSVVLSSIRTRNEVAFKTKIVMVNAISWADNAKKWGKKCTFQKTIFGGVT